MGTDFSSKQENNDSKNDVIKIRKIIYMFIFRSTDFSSKWENNDSENDAIKIRNIYIYIYLFKSTLQYQK